MLEIDARSKAIGIITGGRVKALEDAGLAIIDKTELSELQSLAQAKADGRLVVLPCKEVYTKAGDTLYLIDGGEIIEVTHCGAEISPSGEIYVVVAAEDKIFPFRQPDPENDLDPKDWCTETKEVMLDDFGKTVFLTREEAEKAIGGKEDV